MSSQEYKLEENEKLIYSDETVGLNIDAKMIYWLMLGILGFPFYTWIIMVGLGCATVGMSLQEAWTQLKTPVLIFLDEVILFFPFSFFAARKIPKFLSAPGKIMVTNKRIFVLPQNMQITSVANVPDSLLLSESRYDDILYIATEIYKDRQFLKVKVKSKNLDGELAETFHTYQVKDARAVYASLPSDLVQRRGHASPAAAKEKAGVWGVRIFGLLFLVGLAAFGYFFELQESTTALSKQGHKLIKEHKYDEAERVLELAYKRNMKVPFQVGNYLGPLCYRLAVTKLALGKEDEAIPLLNKAVQLCQKADEDSHKKFFLFRSYARLGHIYQLKNDENKATENYEKMLQYEPLENKDKMRNSGLSAYIDFLKSKGHERKARQVEKIKGDTQTNPHLSLDKIWE